MKNYPKGIFKATVVNLRKKNDRYHLILELADYTPTGHISIDIHDEILETAGLSNISLDLKLKLVKRFPQMVKVSNLNGYWRIQNCEQILSDVISRIL